MLEVNCFSILCWTQKSLDSLDTCNRRINVEKILVNDQVDLHSPIFSDEIIQWFLHLSKDNSVIDQ